MFEASAASAGAFRVCGICFKWRNQRKAHERRPEWKRHSL